MRRALTSLRRRAGAGLSVVACLAVAAVVAGGGALPASARTAACPDSNPPNELIVAGGGTQTAQLGKQFSSPLQVALANTNGCAVTGSLAGVTVQFVAPAGGASGTFASSGTNVAVVATDAQGVAVAPAFTAGDTAGSYGVFAESDYGSAQFSLTNTATGLAASIVASGSGQSAQVFGGYAQPLQAQVLDATGRPVANVAVTFALGTGRFGAGASFAGGGAQATEQTNGSGVATSPPVIANGVAGPFTATASTAGIAAPATFALANLAARETLAAVAPAAQQTTVGGRYGRPLRVTVRDDAGRPLEGASVTFALGVGTYGAGASFAGGGAQATELTDATGTAASPPFTANGVAGRFTATATTASTVTPITFALDNRAAHDALAATRKAAQTAAVDHRYARPLQVRLRDGSGKPIEGATVTFTLGSGAAASQGAGAGATFAAGGTQATDVTDASGLATSPAVVANATAGRFTATAASVGVRPVSFPLRNVAGAPTTITAGAAASESTTVGSRFPVRLAVTVTDKHGNAVPGAVVTFRAPTRGPSGGFGSRGRVVRVRTDASGVAVAPAFVAGRATGGYAVTASVRGAARAAAFALVNEPGA